MARPANSYRSARRNAAKRHKLVWRAIERIRVGIQGQQADGGAIFVRVPVWCFG